MKRISIFIDEKLIEGLNKLVKQESKKQFRKVTMAEIIRNGIRKEVEAVGIADHGDSFREDEKYVHEDDDDES